MSQSPARFAQPMRMPLPLPDLPTEPRGSAAPDDAQVPAGCYLFLVTPIASPLQPMYGTCRLDRSTGHLQASGDLYASFDMDTTDPIPAPDPEAGIPIFPIRNHRYYLRVTEFVAGGGGFAMTFEAHRLSPDTLVLFDGTETGSLVEASFTAHLAPDAAAGKRGPRPRFVGNIVNARGTHIADASMELVSPYLRRASVEIDTVPASAAPLGNSAGLNWHSVYAAVGWDLTIIKGSHDVAEPPDKAWNEAEAHAALSKVRDEVDLDREWRYHFLAVQQIDQRNAERGVMYDRSGTEDNPAREGFMVASHWRIPSEPAWGLVQGKLTYETDTYFRTAVHELGHALGLDHPDVTDNTVSFMQGTDRIALESLNTPETPFPNNIDWSFSREDQHRLRHWPDPIVRPGGFGWRDGANAPVVATASPHIVLEIAPLLPDVPFGTPVRVEASAVNRGAAPAPGPSSVELSSGFVRGWAVNAAGVRRAFAPITVVESGSTRDFAPNERLEGSLTLLWGTDGPLFPMPGTYRVILEVSWRHEGIMFSADAETRIAVAPAVDSAHAETARRLLATRNVLPMLALGGDHLPDAQEAVAAALKNPVLRPHYAYIEAKRVGTRFFNRAPDPAAVARLVGEDTIMSRAERRKAARLAQGASAAESPRREPALA